MIMVNPNKIKETVNKVDKCVDRLQQLQYITGGTKGVRCKQESIRIRNANGQKSPNGKLPTQIGEWKMMSLSAMLLGETVCEILEASQFARLIVANFEKKSKKITITRGDPKTPVTESRSNSRLKPENAELKTRRKREKQIIRSDIHSPLLQRAKSHINFKVSSSPLKKETEKEKKTENRRFLANRVSPKNRPWARKTVIFPNPLFHSSPISENHKFSKNRPITPHKFLIKTPPAKKVSTAAKLRRSFSPSRLAGRLVSPLKSRKLSVTRSCVDGGGMMMNMMSGLKQRPMCGSNL